MSEYRRDWYRMHDVNPRGATLLDAMDDEERDYRAQEWNRKGYGIFWTLNEFDGPRKIANLVRINAWAVDIDDGPKTQQLATLIRSPLVPSFVVETKRGYQAYWNAKDAKAEHWNAIVLQRLVPFFGADKNARDLARILRVPGFFHLKDPTKPFAVRMVHTQTVAYTEAQMVAAFPLEVAPEEERASRSETKQEARWTGSDDFWDRVYQLDCKEGLERLSGHPAVGGERYEFRRVPNGNWNILVDGKGTSCFIDKRGRIGSLDGGGPTLAQWLKWFGLSYRDAAKVIKELFPQISKRAA